MDIKDSIQTLLSVLLKNSEECCILVLGIVGSRAYGLDTEDSDTDISCVIIPPKSYILGLDTFDKFEIRQSDNLGFEGKIMSFEKWYQLLLASNPTASELLFLSQDCYVHTDPKWDSLIKFRKNFISKQMCQSYIGSVDIQANKLKRYDPAASDPDGGRKKRMEQFGYDTKSAMHILRLLNTIDDVLTLERVVVERPERDFLLSVKNGIFSYEEIESQIKTKLSLVGQRRATSEIPEALNTELLHYMYILTVEEHLTYLSKNGYYSKEAP